MDDLNKIDSDNFNANPQNRQNTPSNEGMSRPRLRKIKRPKNHNGPINATPTAMPESKPASQHPQARPRVMPQEDEQETPAAAQVQGGLIRASDRSNPNNNFSPAYSPVPDYMNTYIQDPNDDDEFVYQGNPNSFAANLDTKKIIGLAIGCIVLGLLMGKFVFSSEQVVRDGLQGVVVNPEVPKGRTRCGIAEKTQGCVLYVMNPQRQELNGRDFYDLASQLTGRQRFVIETGNMRYSSVKIKPGNIAQLNIPPLQ